MMYYPLKSMLSKIERDFLSGNFHPNKNYEYKIIHSIRNKLKTFYQLELPLVNSKPEVIGGGASYLAERMPCQANLTSPTDFSNILTEFGKKNSGPDRIRTGDLTLRKRSHYPCYATSPNF